MWTLYTIAVVWSVKNCIKLHEGANLKPVTLYLHAKMLADILFRSAAFLYLIVQQSLKDINKYSPWIKTKDIEIVLLFDETIGHGGNRERSLRVKTERMKYICTKNYRQILKEYSSNFHRGIFITKKERPPGIFFTYFRTWLHGWPSSRHIINTIRLYFILLRMVAN